MWGCFGSPETDDDKPDKVLYNYCYLRTALDLNSRWKFKLSKFTFRIKTLPTIVSIVNQNSEQEDI